jgi:hypothetical protein
VAGVPYLTVTNAYWSPYARQRFPMPELPLSRRIGVPGAAGCSASSAPWRSPPTRGR